MPTDSRCDHCHKTQRAIELVGGRVSCYTCLEIPESVWIWSRNPPALSQQNMAVNCVICKTERLVPAHMEYYGRHFIDIGCVQTLDRFYTWTKKWKEPFRLAHFT